MANIVYPQRYCSIMGRKTAPLVVEAQSACRDLDACSANGIAWVRGHLRFPIAGGSFDDHDDVTPAVSGQTLIKPRLRSLIQKRAESFDRHMVAVGWSRPVALPFIKTAWGHPQPFR